jgi:hypothetical protein
MVLVVAFLSVVWAYIITIVQCVVVLLYFYTMPDTPVGRIADDDSHATDNHVGEINTRTDAADAKVLENEGRNRVP